MRAAELLTILSTSPKSETYTGLYIEKETRQFPVTSVDLTQPKQILLYTEQEKEVFPVKELLLLLMLNKERTIQYWDGEDWQMLFGVKEAGPILLI